MIPVDIPAQLPEQEPDERPSHCVPWLLETSGPAPLALDLDKCFREAAAELRQDERAALLRVAAGTASRADAELLAAALGHTTLFHHVEPEVEPRADEEEPE